MRGLTARAAAIVLLGVALASCRPGGHAISDQSFVKRANEVCAEEQQLDEADPPAGQDASFDERADRVDRGTARLEEMVEKLRAIPVAAEDRAAVANWLGIWDEFLAVGPRYAAAIRTGNPELYEPIGNEGDRPITAINEFARANGLDQCAF